MTDPIPSAGETTNIGLPAISVPITSSADRPLSEQDFATISKLEDNSALLISTRGSSSGSRYLLDEDEITVGRDTRADILLDDATVSRQHAVFRRVDGKYVIEDVGSLNGTYVNMQRVDTQVLKNGDSIMIGKFRMVFFTKSAVITQ
ncbi:MAG: FHA domain-containing protein [Bifidobacteriaceae bacterium]|nr:FHA domain-containing protein [Bifidobacteriaceae bacterium]MCI1979330.1 FHA domain-containing protein [Bifidobacteriaceae bacterium]